MSELAEVMVDYTPPTQSRVPALRQPQARTVYCEPWFKGDRVWFRKAAACLP